MDGLTKFIYISSPIFNQRNCFSIANNKKKMKKRRQEKKITNIFYRLQSITVFVFFFSMALILLRKHHLEFVYATKSVIKI